MNDLASVSKPGLRDRLRKLFNWQRLISLLQRLNRNTVLSRLATFDSSFVLLAGLACIIAYLIPFLYYPEDPSNPWPYAYNVIQSRIIASGQFLNTVPQFGAFVRLDYGWFVVHHLTIVMFKLVTGLSFESQERILSVILSVVFFLGFYQFTKQAFGNPIAFASSLFFLLVPRTYNYLPNVNGELIAWLIFFPALISFFTFIKVQRTKFLVLSSLLASSIVISNLMVFAEFLLIIGSYLIARTILTKDTGRIIAKTTLFLVIALVLIPLPVLITSGDLLPGSSSTIGSLYSTHNPIEAQYEMSYYQKYDWGWKLFVSQSPIQVQLYYLSNDGFYFNYLLIFFIPLAVIGLVGCILHIRKLPYLFVLTWLATSLASSSLLLSRVFDITVIAGSIRILLYFAWPLSIVSGLGLLFLWQIVRYRFKLVPFAIFIIALLVVGLYFGSLSAGLSNSQPKLYLKEYQDALAWLGTNTDPNSIVMMNDWTVGEVWMKSSRLSLTESGVGSASYSTYQEIVTKLDDANTILTSTNMSETISLMHKHSITWILVWNRPSALNIVTFDGVNFAKFNNATAFQMAFSVEHTYSEYSNAPFPGAFSAKAIIFHLNATTTSFQPIGA